jgi:hypothetical protein
MHEQSHPWAGCEVILDLVAVTKGGVLYSGRSVVLADWQERITGHPWGNWRHRGPQVLRRDYLARTAGKIDPSDADVVAVITPHDERVYLVHDSEVRLAREMR